MTDDRLTEIAARAAASADPGACGTCRSRVRDGLSVEHDECAARATLFEAPGQPDYEELVDLTADQKTALPAQFHTPVFDKLGTPKAWLCRVCWGDGWVTKWPCATAQKHGAQVFTEKDLAERTGQQLADQLEQARSIAVELENENARLTAELAKYDGKEPTVAEEMQHLNRCLTAVYDLCEETKQGARRWENPLPVPEWVAAVEKAADGDRPDNPDDKRRRIYIDGTGHAWIDQSVTSEGTRWIAPVAGSLPGAVETEASVADRTGSLREIGRAW